MSKPKLAVFGLHHGFKHASDIRYGDFAELVAACGDTDLSRQRAAQLGVPLHETIDGCLDAVGSRIDGAVLALPNDLHWPVTRECARRGINVLVEKPIAGTVEDANRMIEAADKAGVKFLVGHHRRFSAKLRRARQEITGGGIGRLVGANVMWVAKKPDPYFQAEWRVTPEKGGGPLLINTIHDIDDLRFATGQDISWVFAKAVNIVRGNRVEDTVSISFGTTGGAVGTIFVSDGVPSPWFYESNARENLVFAMSFDNSYFFFGTTGSLAFPNLRKYWYDDPAMVGWNYQIKDEALPVPAVDPMTEEIIHFCKVIKGEEKPFVTGPDATVTLKAINAVKKSIAEGVPVEVE
ncbi:MAG: Gfo/Idh/MocA family oxidoreductase [Firmicutes bacterium]|nr:Gfo/Idh/MocA family oxidoreductase [Bacillota bacterium]